MPPRAALYFSLEKKSCPRCSWFVCCSFAFLPHSFHMPITLQLRFSIKLWWSANPWPVPLSPVSDVCGPLPLLPSSPSHLHLLPLLHQPHPLPVLLPAHARPQSRGRLQHTTSEMYSHVPHIHMLLATSYCMKLSREKNIADLTVCEPLLEISDIFNWRDNLFLCTYIYLLNSLWTGAF